MTKYFYYRVTVSVAMDMYLPEEETERTGEDVVPTEAAQRDFEKEIKDVLDQGYLVYDVTLEDLAFDRTEESD